MFNSKLLKFWGIRYIPDNSRSKTRITSLTDTDNISEFNDEHDAHFAADTRTKQQILDDLKSKLEKCKECPLWETRTHMVFGEGNPDAEIFFVGEAPGFEEDRQGRPFVGRAGKLLTDIIVKGMGLKREDVYIGNILKCRPPQNRTPNPQEIIACGKNVFKQLRIVCPKVIVALGSPAAKTLLDTKESIGKLRGRFFDYYLDGPSANSGPVAKLMPTYHPAYLLRNPADKIKVWEDIKQVMAYLNIPIPSQRKR